MTAMLKFLQNDFCMFNLPHLLFVQLICFKIKAVEMRDIDACHGLHIAFKYTIRSIVCEASSH